MNSLKMNYKSYFGKDFVALCFFDRINSGVKVTACLCSEQENASLRYQISNQDIEADFYYSCKKNVEGRVVNFNYFIINLTKEQMQDGTAISFESIPLAAFSKFPIDIRSLSYFFFDEYVLYLDNRCVCVSLKENAPLKKIKKNHRRAMRACFKTDKKNVIKASVIRLAHNICSPFFKKDIWLVADRKDLGGDNGEAFFEYLASQKLENKSVYFVINKSSCHLARIKKLGKVLHPRSFKYKLYYTFATRLIASQLEYDIVNPIFADGYLKDILHKCKVVFLQHGIIKDDLSKTYNRYERPLDIFVTSTVDEYNSIAKSNDYGYGEGIVKLTGLARYDKLTSGQEKIIFICPSWRKYCLKDTETKEPVDGIEKTPAYVFYNSLLSNKKLIDKATATGYKICFYPHHMIEKCFESIDLTNPVFINHKGISYKEMFCRGSLLMTDYSSVQFDFAYLKKPVVYCQPDKEEFFASHTYIQGYFDYERDGFGQVCYEPQALVSLLCDYMDNGCTLQNVYRERIEKTFKFNDQENCKRILDEVINLDNENNY